jgi:dTDP-4-amino-4,6-dideoxygalactose transaminase
MESGLTRRGFLAAASAAGVGLTIQGTSALAAADAKPALLGGPRVRKAPFPSWPVFDETEEKALLDVLRSGKWFRVGAKHVAAFEEAYAERMGAKRCVATANGTSALMVAMSALGVQAGDEVLLPPYTFIACPNSILALGALPVFVDVDPETFVIDAAKIEAAITDRTVALMPVHLGGNVVDLDAVLEVARKHKLAVVEDTCQAHLSEWKGRKAGTYGNAGAFSFQASKNLNAGEGGAILTNDDALADHCYALHDNSRECKGGGYTRRGANFRMTEFQGGLLLAQMARIEAQARRRTENALYLTSLLREVPGIAPARLYEGCTRNAYHLYMLRYDSSKFAGLPRAAFLKALSAEGIPASGGYTPLNKFPFIRQALDARGFQRVFSKERIALWEQRNECPANDRLCTEAVWMTQNVFLGERTDMEQIAEAVRKIHTHAAELAKA